MKRKRGVAVKKRKLKKRTRGATVPIPNLPRPPCPVLMSYLPTYLPIKKGSLISPKICTLEIHDD